MTTLNHRLTTSVYVNAIRSRFMLNVYVGREFMADVTRWPFYGHHFYGQCATLTVFTATVFTAVNYINHFNCLPFYGQYTT